MAWLLSKPSPNTIDTYTHIYTPRHTTMAAASAAPLAINGAVKMGTISQAYLEGSRVRETKALISELCRQFYHLGWVSGTGGSITIKVHDDSIPKPQQLIVMSPSGICICIFCAYAMFFCVFLSKDFIFMVRFHVHFCFSVGGCFG